VARSYNSASLGASLGRDRSFDFKLPGDQDTSRVNCDVLQTSLDHMIQAAKDAARRGDSETAEKIIDQAVEFYMRMEENGCHPTWQP
jgi:pentatricopeptide repeat protein